MRNNVVPVNLEMDPARFYALAATLKSVSDREIDAIDQAGKNVASLLDEIEAEVMELGRANNTMTQQLRLTTRREHNPFEIEDEGLEELMHSASGSNFIAISFRVFHSIYVSAQKIFDLITGLTPGPLVLSKRLHGKDDIENMEHLQHMVYEFQLNKPTIERFIHAIGRLESSRALCYDQAVDVERVFDSYYKALLDRHSVQGIEVHEDPVLTDVAISVFENVDSNGEIADGKKPDKLSAYSVRKALIIADTVKTGAIRKLIDNPKSLNGKAAEYLRTLWDVVVELTNSFKNRIVAVETASGMRKPHAKNVGETDFMAVIHSIAEDLDPNTIVFKEKTVLLTAQERFNLEFRNKTLRELTKLIKRKSSGSQELVDYVLQRKETLRNYFRDENSFYVCQIGQGNKFMGETPGALSVIPGIRPNVNLDEILGSGFAEIRDFVNTIEASSKFSDLFMATSPSKSTDKANVLLVGPQGCGKTEILRAVGGDKKSIGVFAQGSDFLTCWMGEAQKNPKRLFEAGLKIQKESRRHVHFLIDEIDSLLHNEERRGETNLTLEFQILMDGVVNYPHLSVWGATNSPHRIPMPMIRRFNKVVIVGELTQDHRVKLLKQFLSFMPCDVINDSHWEEFGQKLDGATGDVIRKIVDHIWRTKMTWFVENHRDEAEKLVKELNADEKFQIANFDAAKRAQFQAKLSNFMKVDSANVGKSIDIHLENVAIHSEIETAKTTYENAKAFLAQIKSSEV
jgi:AAA+ superfamily predicted ATPase